MPSAWSPSSLTFKRACRCRPSRARRKRFGRAAAHRPSRARRKRFGRAATAAQRPSRTRRKRFGQAAAQRPSRARRPTQHTHRAAAAPHSRSCRPFSRRHPPQRRPPVLTSVATYAISRATSTRGSRLEQGAWLRVKFSVKRGHRGAHFPPRETHFSRSGQGASGKPGGCTYGGAVFLSSQVKLIFSPK